MKKLLCFLLLWGMLTLLSCTAPAPEPSDELTRSVMVACRDCWVVGGERYVPLPLDEETQNGGGIGRADGEEQKQIPFEGSEVMGISYYGDTWYACEKKGEDCGGNGAQLVYWNEEEREQKRVTDLCSCEGSRYLLAGDWVFYNQVCDSPLQSKGLYGYRAKDRSFCYFEGEVAGLGLRGDQPHVLLLEGEMASLYGIETEGKRPELKALASWDKLPLAAGRLVQGECFFYDTVTVSFLEGEGFCLWEEGKQARFLPIQAHCAASSRNCLFFGADSSLYRVNIKERQVERIHSMPSEDARFTLFATGDGQLFFEAKQCHAVDVLLWRWERDYVMVWREKEKACTVVSSQWRILELPADQLPFVIGVPRY